MSPLVALAISLVPELAQRVAGRVLPGIGVKVEDQLVKTVTEVLGTDDATKAESLVQDPKVAAELRVRLAKIEVEARRVEAEEREKARRAELDRLKADLAQHRSELQDTQDARELLENLSDKDSVFAWGPVIVSTIVVLGFFVTLSALILGEIKIDSTNEGLWQIINIAVGALTAGFATVISFWLGSSQGSRKKDSNALLAQKAQTFFEINRQRDTPLQPSSIVLPATAAQQIGPMTGAIPPAKEARRFQNCFEVLMRHEGGYVNDPADNGGATNMGITHKTLARWLDRDEVTEGEVRDLTPELAQAIYRNWYWNALNCDQLPRGVDLSVFDFGVNAGPTASAKLLQRVLAVEDDGQIGPITIGATRQYDPRQIITEFADLRLEFYRKLDGWGRFGGGWTNRTLAVRDTALSMLDGASA